MPKANDKAKKRKRLLQWICKQSTHNMQIVNKVTGQERCIKCDYASNRTA